MATAYWAPATLYQPGALVQPRSGLPVNQSAPDNPSFEDGDTGWTVTDPALTITTGGGIPPYDGTWVLFLGAFLGVANAYNDNQVPVVPGQSITAVCYVNTAGETSAGAVGARVEIAWYDDASVFISASGGNLVERTRNTWAASVVTDSAPAGAAYAAIGTQVFRTSGSTGMAIDTFSWDYVYAPPPDGLIFRAVQTNAATSAVSEPTWPTTLGNTVVDGGVTWEAVQASRVVWEASPILVSDSSEPTWPEAVNGSVIDNTISWVATTGFIADAKCPRSPVVAIAASKVFAADDDIIRFSATINPLDWSSVNDAGYLPFGLQTYGSTSITALGLYRSNLVAFNSQSFQMWQVDQDPANMAILDSVPIGCTYPKTVQPLANDLLFLAKTGFRNVSIAGASTNLQADGVGEPIDALTVAKIKEGVYEPFSLFYPGTGQYWGVFGPDVFVLTINGAKSKSWSRYTFPEALTDWTVHGSDLYLRAGDNVWVLDEDCTADDVQDPIVTFTLGMSVTSFSIAVGTNAQGPLPTGTGTGYYSGEVFSGISCGLIVPDPTQVAGDNVEVCGWSSNSGGLFVFALTGTHAANAFSTITLSVGGLSFASSGATFSTSLVPGFSIWTWADSHQNTYIGQNVGVTVAL